VEEQQRKGMIVTADTLPLTDIVAPVDQAGVVEVVRASHDSHEAVCPLGGRTSLDYGIAATREGRGLDLAGLNHIVDYTPRDMTILVEAGVRMADLAATLAAEGQQLPIDVPRAEEATIGGAVATNWAGSRRHGYGTLRDYVIGIHAVDGRGVAFKGGGRVVKNVAGYDFCKLLTGSFGTLGVITQVALKVKPKAEQSATIVATRADWNTTEGLLRRLIQLAAPPAAIDLLVGEAWRESTGRSSDADPQSPAIVATLVVRAEGTEAEVAALAENVQYELWTGGGGEVRLLSSAEADAIWLRQVEFADRGAGAAPDEAVLVLKIAVPPSAVTAMLAAVQNCVPSCTIQAHAGNGIIIARIAALEASDVSRVIVGKLRPAAVQHGGSVVIISSKLDGLTPHVVWGGRSQATTLMESIKRQFDPRNILNPGRFVY
jgi:glycolate oxidase FAD binding subunit